MSLTLCVVLLDIVPEAVRSLYSDRSETLIISIQGTENRDETRKTYRMVTSITEYAKLPELDELKAFPCKIDCVTSRTANAAR